MAKFNFDVSEVDVNATGTFDPIPAGEYTLKALEAEEKQTKSGGTMIKVKFQVVGGDFDGRLIWNNYNIVNASEKAQNIGRQQLVAWATAAGKPEADDTDKLIDRKFKAMVSIEKGTGGYADSNSIKSYLFSDEAPKTSKPATPAKPAAPVKSQSTKNPWDD